MTSCYCKHVDRDRGRQTETETDRQTDRKTDRDRHRQGQRETERQTEADRQTEKQKEIPFDIMLLRPRGFCYSCHERQQSRSLVDKEKYILPFKFQTDRQTKRQADRQTDRRRSRKNSLCSGTVVNTVSLLHLLQKDRQSKQNNSLWSISGRNILPFKFQTDRQTDRQTDGEAERIHFAMELLRPL